MYAQLRKIREKIGSWFRMTSYHLLIGKQPYFTYTFPGGNSQLGASNVGKTLDGLSSLMRGSARLLEDGTGTFLKLADTFGSRRRK